MDFLIPTVRGKLPFDDVEMGVERKKYFSPQSCPSLCPNVIRAFMQCLSTGFKRASLSMNECTDVFELALERVVCLDLLFDFFTAMNHGRVIAPTEFLPNRGI